MSGFVGKVLFDLVQVASGSERPPLFDRARLLRQAAVTISALREQIGTVPRPGRQIVDELNNMADSIDLHTWPEVGNLILRAVTEIKSLHDELDGAQ